MAHSTFFLETSCLAGSGAAFLRYPPYAEDVAGVGHAPGARCIVALMSAHADEGGLRKAHPRRCWGRLLLRWARLWPGQPARTGDLVRRSYDRIAPGWDRAWTRHMRDRSLEMLDKLESECNAFRDKALSSRPVAVDLACGTGFMTGELARRFGGEVYAECFLVGLAAAADVAIYA